MARAHIDVARAQAGGSYYDCAACEANPAMKAMLGHDGPPTQFWRANVISEAPLARCPRRDLLEAATEEATLVAEIARHVDLYFPAYQQGILLAAGGLANQPALYAEYMHRCTIVDAAVQRRLQPSEPEEQA